MKILKTTHRRCLRM